MFKDLPLYQKVKLILGGLLGLSGFILLIAGTFFGLSVLPKVLLVILGFFGLLFFLFLLLVAFLVFVYWKTYHA